jgi:peptidyl-prolyl cis-trans isomerase C
MKYRLLIILVVFLAVACGESQQPDSPASLIDEEDVLLVLVDGEPITLTMLEFAMEMRGVAESDPEGMRSLLDELIRMQAVANAAEASGLAEDPRVRAQRRLRDLETLQMNYLAQHADALEVSEDEIQQVYQAQTGRSGDRQYRIETLVYPNQQRVLRVLASIDSGDIGFDDIKNDLEPDVQADSPIWVDLSQVPPDFSTLLEQSEPGDVLPSPLPSPQGWRIVRVIEQRDFDPPTLESVRDGIVQTITRDRVRAHVETLFDAARITPMLPLDDESGSEDPNS